MNEAVEAFAVPFAASTAALTRISRGDLAEPLAESFGGEFDRQRDAIDAMVRFLLLRAEDIRLLIGGAGAGCAPGGHGGDARARIGPGASR